VKALAIVEPETVIRWHRAGFRMFWRWKSRSRSGRPRVALEIRQLIREMSLANPLWGAPRIHGELLKLGIDIGQTSAAKYMVKRRKPPLQGWKTFLRNHADGIASMDLFVVPTFSFKLLYGLLILRHAPHVMARCDGASHRRMAGPATHRSLRLGLPASGMPSSTRKIRFFGWQTIPVAIARLIGENRMALISVAVLGASRYTSRGELDAGAVPTGSESMSMPSFRRSPRPSAAAGSRCLGAPLAFSEDLECGVGVASAERSSPVTRRYS
jgi:hypothetical protein